MPSTFKLSALISLIATAFSPAAHSANSYVLTSGSAQLTLSTNALQSFQSAGITVSPMAPATYTAPVISFSASDAGVTYGSGSSVSAMMANGGLTLSSSTVNGARIDLTHITVDATTGNVFADGSTQSWTNATLGNYTGSSFTNLQLFSSSLSGNANIATGNGSIALTLADLKFSSAAIPVLGNALGVPSFLQNLIFPGLNVGSVAVAASFNPLSAPSVPEPGTWLLMTWGLAGLVYARRQHHG